MLELFNFNKTEQEKIDWNWFWKVEVPDRISNLKIVKFYNNSKALFKSSKSDNDGLPF